MKKSKWWHIERWFLRMKTKSKEYKLWLQEYENFLETATPEQLNQFLSDMRTIEEIEAQTKEIDGDVILDKVISIVDILLLISGVSMIICAFIMVYLDINNAEVIVYFAVGTLSIIYALFDRRCKAHTY